MSDHRAVREALGAYLLGALAPGERREVEDHLDGCSACRDELARLSAVPPLLGRVTVSEVTSGALVAGRDPIPAVVERAAQDRRRIRRHLWGWRAAAAAAAVVAVLALAPWDRPDASPSFPATPESPVAATIEGDVTPYAWEWGTTLSLQVQHLPQRDAYVLWAVAADGRREQAGTWGPTSHGGAQVRGATAIQRSDLRRVEVTDADGQPLFSFDVDG